MARYFNGRDWIGPIEINIEHKAFFNGDLGPKTYEMGTIIWYDADERNKLFQETLAKLKGSAIQTVASPSQGYFPEIS